MIIDRFQASQAEEVAELIKRNLLEITSKYYSPEYIASLINHHSPTELLDKALAQYIFVALEDGSAIGTGSLANLGTPEMPTYYGTAIFVALEFHRKGVGRQIMRRVEEKALELGAAKITVRAAVNACQFYEKLGYTYQDGIEMPDEKGNFVMIKRF
ncbi:MAG: GNAT family N-acetyltransferase [Anaerolineales bacterium]|jgi:GNAT superfamily N-acetyltransferase